MVDKLNKRNTWTVRRDDRFGPLSSQWVKSTTKFGAMGNKIVDEPWCGGAPFRGSKGGGQMCFATGIGPTDLSSNDVMRQQENGYHLAGISGKYRVPTAWRGKKPPCLDYLHETLRPPPSPPRSPRPPDKTADNWPILPWKTEWYGQPKRLQRPGYSHLSDTFHVSKGGEGMAPSHDIGNVGLKSRVERQPEKPWTASRPLQSPQRATMRLERLEMRSIPRQRTAGTRPSRRGHMGLSNLPGGPSGKLNLASFTY